MKENRKNSQSRIDANQKYDRKWTKNYGFKLNRKYDFDVMDKLETIGNKQAYITDLIRADLAKSRPTVQQTIDNAQKYGGYVPLKIYPTTDLSVIYEDLITDGYSDEEAAEFIADDTWVNICSDGVIILADSNEADFEWHGKHYTVTGGKWAAE